MILVEEHKIKFENKVNEEQEKKGKNSRMLSKMHYEIHVATRVVNLVYIMNI